MQNRLGIELSKPAVRIRLATLIVVVGLSHIFLPLVHRTEIFPIFAWRMFNNMAYAGQYYDLRLRFADGHICFFSTCPGIKKKINSVMTYGRIQELPFVSGAEKQENLHLIDGQLNLIGAKIEDADLIHIKGFLGDHILRIDSGDQDESELEDLGRATNP